MSTKQLWAVNPNYKRPAAVLALLHNSEYMKACAMRRMAMFDKLPPAVRAAIREYGQFPAAISCTSRRASAKVEAVKAAYAKKLARSAVYLGEAAPSSPLDDLA